MRKKLSQTKLLHFNQIVDGEWERRELNWSDLYTFDCVPIPPKERKIVDNCLLACNEMRLREIPGREPNVCLAAKVI